MDVTVGGVMVVITNTVIEGLVCSIGGYAAVVMV